MNDLIKSLNTPQFKRVIFEDTPVGCIPLYDYNQDDDIPYTFWFEDEDNYANPKIVIAKDLFGLTPPHGDYRIVAGLVPITYVNEIKLALMNLDNDFCKNRELIILYRIKDQFIGILIRQPLKEKEKIVVQSTPHKKESFFYNLFKKEEINDVTIVKQLNLITHQISYHA